MVITRNGDVVLSETIPLLVQQFGEAAGAHPAEMGKAAAWATNIIDKMKSTFTSGTFLGLDLERTMNLWVEGVLPDMPSGSKDEDPPDENPSDPPVKTIYSRWAYDSGKYNQVLAEQAALYAMLAYDETIHYGSGEMDYYSIKLSSERRRYDHDPHALISQLKLDGYEVGTPQNYCDGLEDNISYVLGHKRVNDDEDLLAVVLRGTDSVEWYGNMEVGTGTRHESFQLANLTLAAAVQKYIEDNDLKNVIYFVTGHSRGAAVANLYAADLTEKIGKGNVFCYAFATPNNTTSPIKRKNIFNFCFEDDFVPQVPLEKWGYSKYGRTSIANAQAIYQNPLSNNNRTFTQAVNTYIQFSEKRKPSFDFAATEKVLKDFYALAPTVRAYYETRYDAESLYVLTPISILVPISRISTHDFMREYIAYAAIHDEIDTIKILTVLKKLPAGNGFKTIADFFVVPALEWPPFHMRYSINDTHQAFTYYAALKAGCFPEPR
jgi:hypothetical protein